MAGRIRVRNVKYAGKNKISSAMRCVVVTRTLEAGDTVKRGCGNRGMVFCDVGWRCLYCGNLVYCPDTSLNSLWFHFKVGREYWRIMNRESVNYLNGIPVHGEIDPLPRFLRADLEEKQPPKWFPYFLIYDEYQFKHYLEMSRYGRDR